MCACVLTQKSEEAPASSASLLATPSSTSGLIPRLIFFMRKSLEMRLYQQCVSLIPRPSVSCTGNETKSGCTHCCEIALNTGKH